MDIARIKEVLTEAYLIGKHESLKGDVVNYIPALSRAKKDDFGITLITNKNDVINLGDTNTRFTMQSVSKIVILLFSLEKYGKDITFENVLMEPTGDSFNSILKLDTVSALPFNPLINAGAIELISKISNDYEFEDLLEYTKHITGDHYITLNEEVYLSEKETGDRNRSIAYLLKSKGVLLGEVDKTLDIYFKMCSLNVTSVTLAKLGLILSNKGINPKDKESYVKHENAKIVLSLMYTCGMYDESGEYGVLVGLPSKSGVGGGICVATNHDLAIGIYGPSLNKKGNSYGGVKALEYISENLHLNVFD